MWEDPPNSRTAGAAQAARWATAAAVGGERRLREGAGGVLDATGWANRTIPFRFNRLVLFDSQRLHGTVRPLGFSPGYLARRVSISRCSLEIEIWTRRRRPFVPRDNEAVCDVLVLYML